MKRFKRGLSLLLVLCLCLSMVPAYSVSTASSYEYAWFPAPVMNVNQIAYENHSHGSQNAIDILPGGTVFAPFTGKIVYRDPNWGYVMLQSSDKVIWADGSCDYMSVGFMHDENIGDLYVGKVINQGENFYHAGGMGNGNPNAYGDHVHITVHRGKVTRGYPYGTGDKDAYAFKAFYVNKDKTPTSAGRGGGYVAPGGTVNNGAPTDYRELWKYLNVPSEPTAFLSINRRSYNPNDTITLTFGGNNNGTYTLGIYKDSNRIDTVTVYGSTYQFKLSETGNYSAYMTAYNSNGLADSNWVDWKVTDLTVTLSVNAEKHDIGNPVTLTIGGNNCLTTSDGPCTLGIFKEGQWFDTVTLYDENYSRSFSEPGAYSAYVTAYSETDYVDSDYVSWLVVEYPEAPTLRCPDLLYDANNNITFAWDACSKTDYYDFWILQGDTDIYNMIGIESLSHTFRLPVGTYTAKVASVNRKYGTWTWSNTYEFTVDDRHPERPVLTVDKKEAYNGQVIRLSWNDCTNTDDYDFYVYDANGNTVLTDFYYTQLHKDVVLDPGKYTAIVASVNRTHGTWLWSNEVSFTILNHDCSYSYNVTKAPTTSATGTLTGTCTKCSGTTTVTLPKLDTTNYTYKVTKEPTCTATGTGRYTWKTTTYGSFYFDVSIAAKGHTYTSKVTAPTCTAQGYTTYTCACGDSYKDSYTTATGHSYTYKATKAPTTSATGTLTGTCSKCSGTTTVTLPKLDTTNYTYKVTKEATCTATGTGRYTWKTTTYGSFYFDVSIAAKGHTYTSKVTAPTCTAQGYTTHTCACGHSYKDSYTPATGHSYSYKATKAPTTSATGTLTGTCSKCSGTTTVTLPKLNTTDYTYKVTKEATCTTTGTGRYTWKTTTYGSFYFDVSIAAKGHSYTSKVTAPTCTEQGYTTHTCACGHSYKDNYTAATGHSYSYVVSNAPTTSAAGTLTGTCSRCSGTTTVTLPKLDTTNYTYKVTKEPTCTAAGTGRYTWKTTTYGSFYFDVSIAAKGHTYTSQVTAPTCTQKGYTTHTCQCGHSFVDSYVNALGHDMGKWTVVNAATCTKAGSERRDCSRCDHYETRNVSATGHSYEPHVTAPTCTVGGYTQYICAACGSSYTSDYTDATGHDHKAKVTAATCTSQGYTTYTCHCGDSYVSDYTNALGHDMGDWITVTEATCTENGQQIQKCSRCDHSKTRTTEALGHAWDDGIMTIEPTEDTEGKMIYTCERCGLTRTEVIPALDHEHRYDAIVTAPTCTKQGYTTHTCDCGHSFVDTYVDALGHDMGRWFTISDATCTEDGLEQRDCSHCDYCETRENSASGHTYKSMSTAPTCTNMGFTTHTCHCGDSYTDSYIDPLGHSFTVYASDGNATCTQDGTKTAVCDRCDIKDTVIDKGSARGHDFTEWTVIQKPTVTSEGLEFRYCLVCGIGETRHVAWSENPFTDVPDGSFYYEPVLWAVENGITNGATATTFNPNGTCLRAHVVTFLHRAVGNPEPNSTENPFTDVKSSDFFYKPVLWAVEKGITNGTSATTFGSFANCNRAAVVTFLWRAAGSPAPKSTSNPFVDVKATDFFYKPVLWAVENGITAGIDATHFGPTADCNRAQVVTFLYRAFN